MTARPLRITLVSLLGFASALFGLAGLVALSRIGGPGASLLPKWYVLFSGLMSVGFCAAFVGLWQMKKWGVFAIAALSLLSHGVALATHHFSAPGLAMSLVIFGLAASKIDDME